jgi:uncharacterized protein
MKKTLRKTVALILLAVGVCDAALKPEQVVQSARRQVGVTTSYDSAYRPLSYPGGDVPRHTGVCSDVVIRALREQGVDLQKMVHEDMTRDFAGYPQKWGLSKPDANIDHRRVPNLMTYFKRRGYALPVSQEAQSYAAGDIVAWDLGKGLTHLGIVSDRKGAQGTPWIIHNIGAGVAEADVLFSYRVIGHYRLR